MAEKIFLNIVDGLDIAKHTSHRESESKVGQDIYCLASKDPAKLADSLHTANGAGVRYAILLVPEDIGPRANFGRAGAYEGPAAFTTYFVNMQSNRFLEYSRVAFVGSVDVADLMARSNGSESSVDALRGLCQELDVRVSAIVELIAKAGIEPIVIGGGNNNSLSTIRGVVNALRGLSGKSDVAIAVSNCDPHADFRGMEGHHSGNPFNYASAQGLLKKYCVLGLHENYNSEEMLERLDTSGFSYFSYESFAIRKDVTFEHCVEQTYHYLYQGSLPVGCELDMDSIKNMPASAKTPFGISQEEAAYYIHSLASRLDCSYLHLSEAAPKLGGEDGARDAGKGLALMVVTYLKARELYKEQHGAHGGFYRTA